MYRVIDDDLVPEQVATLPAEALSAYAQARALLEVAPWAGNPYRREMPDGPMRTLACPPRIWRGRATSRTRSTARGTSGWFSRAVDTITAAYEQAGIL